MDAEGRPTTDPAAALEGSLVSMGGYKGWGFGLMAELLAAGMTGSVPSRRVNPLKAPEGPPHDLGQFYLLIDPGTAPGFAATVEEVAAAVAEDDAGRMPGAQLAWTDPVDVPAPLWAACRALAGAD